MAERLTDKHRKKIIADYITLGTYSAAARKNGVSRNTVKSIVLADTDIAEKCQRKKSRTPTIFWPTWTRRKMRCAS